MKTMIALALLVVSVTTASSAEMVKFMFHGPKVPTKIVQELKVSGIEAGPATCHGLSKDFLNCSVMIPKSEKRDPSAIIEASIYVSTQAAAQIEAEKKAAAQAAFDKLIQSVEAMSEKPILSEPEKAALSEQIAR